MPNDVEMDRMFMAMALMRMMTDQACRKMRKVRGDQNKRQRSGRLLTMASRLSAL